MKNPDTLAGLPYGRPRSTSLPDLVQLIEQTGHEQPGPFAPVPLQDLHHYYGAVRLRWLKTVVVSDEEKASWEAPVGIRKASVSESSLKCRNNKQVTSKPGRVPCSGMSLVDAR
ncbi:hypothetical protein GCM10029978_065950 [Actinoallomurus acanthiterrae]